MKINPGWGTIRKDILKAGQQNTGPMQRGSFSDIMQQHDENATEEQLKRMLDRIDQQAERLSKSMTVRELMQYRHMVKRFLEETVRRGVGIKNTRGIDRRGRSKRYKILDEIDAHLLEMGEDLLQHEEGRMDILKKIGEIRGLLINLVF